MQALKAALAWLFVLLAGAAHAGDVELAAFAEKYPAFSQRMGCGGCHMQPMPALNSYGLHYRSAVLARGGRVAANVKAALADIEALDTDRDRYSNFEEIYADSHPGDPNSKPSVYAYFEYPSQQDYPSPGVVTIPLTLYNTGAQAESFNVEAVRLGGEHWPVSLTGSGAGVPARGTAQFQVVVSIPDSAPQGTWIELEFLAHSVRFPVLTFPHLPQDRARVVVAVHRPGDRYVDAKRGVDAGECRVQLDPCRTITFALSKIHAVPGAHNAIHVMPGLYNTASGEVFPLRPKAGSSITGASGAGRVVVDATGTGTRVFDGDGPVGIFNLDVVGGRHTAAPGEVARGAAVNAPYGGGFSRVVFRDNVARGHDGTPEFPDGGAAMGGAVWVGEGTLWLEGNVFEGNAAVGGRALDRPLESTPAVGGSAEGGAVYAALHGRAAGNTFHGNEARGGAGGSSLAGIGAGGDASGGALHMAPVARDDFMRDVVASNIFAANTARAGGEGTAAAGAARAGALRFLSPGGTVVIDANMFYANLAAGGVTEGDAIGTRALTGVDPQFHHEPHSLRRVFGAPVTPYSEYFNGMDPEMALEAGAYARSPYPADRHDLDGDRRSDILWRNATTGVVQRMKMDGLRVVASEPIYSEPNPDWQIVGTCDFDGDRRAELVWHHRAAGLVFVQGFEADGRERSGRYLSRASAPSWKPVTCLGMNANRQTTLVWKNEVTHEIWTMSLSDSGAIVAERSLGKAPGWNFVGSAVFSTQRWESMWQEEARGLLAFAGGRVVRQPADPEWEAAGVGNFDGDQQLDVVWRHRGTGEVYLVFGESSGPVRGWEGLVHVEPDLRWKIVALGDYDGDGKSDILWRHADTGEVYLWLMDGLRIRERGAIHREPDPAWRIVGTR